MHGADRTSRQAHHNLLALQRNIAASPRKATVGQTVTVTGTGFIPGRTPNGTTSWTASVCSRRFLASSARPARRSPTRPRRCLARPGTPSRRRCGPDVTAQPVTVSGPDGNGDATATIDTTGWAVGTYTVTITGDLITQKISFIIRH